MWDYLIYCSVDERPLFMFLYCHYLQRGPSSYIYNWINNGLWMLFSFFFFWLQSTSQLQLPFTSDILLSLESIHDLLMPKSKSFFFPFSKDILACGGGGGGTTSINNSNLLTFPYLLRWRFLVNPFLFLISPLNLKLMHISWHSYFRSQFFSFTWPDVIFPEFHWFNLTH